MRTTSAEMQTGLIAVRAELKSDTFCRLIERKSST